MKKRYLFGIILLILAIVTYWLFLQDLEVSVYYTIGWIVAVFTLLILANRFITIQFDRYFPWLKFGGLRLFLHLILGIIASLIIINLAYLAFKSFFTTEPPTNAQLVVMNVYGTAIFIPLFSIYFSFEFLTHWRKSEVEAEKFRKEHLRSQLESLKSHLDPHFLFNNLNILSSLIDKDSKLSKQFLDKFAEVYRIILRSKDEDLISLQEELAFIDAYIFLIKTRFENVEVQFNIHEADKQHTLPPLTLQMLIENVLKHNIIPENKPLKIKIASGGDGQVTVSNTLNEKPESLKEGGGSGLKNIKDRYKYFTNREVVVEKTNETFKVTLPLIEIETI